MMNYGQMCLPQLKNLLAARGAKVTGRKAELVARLEDYDRNHNFGYDTVYANEEHITLLVPAERTFKDINADCLLPKLTRSHITEYLKRFNKSIGPAENMYREGYLNYVRFSIEDEFYFMKGLCSSQMKKSVKYHVYVQLLMDGRIVGAKCECVAGKPPEAHCKHVTTTLLALEQMTCEGDMILEKTCTEKLQTFHQPKKPYTGSPVKVSMANHCLSVDANNNQGNDNNNNVQPPNRPTKAEIEAYKSRFRNLCINYGYNSTMPIKQLIEPANPYALVLDHNYSKTTPPERLLKSIGLLEVPDAMIEDIEKKTRKQRNSKAWHAERRIRITSSNFGRCCTVNSEKQGLKLAKELLDPPNFCSNATSHGIIYEKEAISSYEAFLNGALKIKECGLFVVQSHPYLAASPDGLIAELTVAEVKCPYSIRDQVASELNLPYLEIDHMGNLALVRTHGYYYQIQGQLLATGRKFCDLIIFTFKGIRIISVERDDEFIDDMKSKLTDFYDKYFEPCLLDKYLYRYYYNYNFKK